MTKQNSSIQRKLARSASLFITFLVIPAYLFDSYNYQIAETFGPQVGLAVFILLIVIMGVLMPFITECTRRTMLKQIVTLTLIVIGAIVGLTFTGYLAEAEITLSLGLVMGVYIVLYTIGFSVGQRLKARFGTETLYASALSAWENR